MVEEAVDDGEDENAETGAGTLAEEKGFPASFDEKVTLRDASAVEGDDDRTETHTVDINIPADSTDEGLT